MRMTTKPMTSVNVVLWAIAAGAIVSIAAAQTAAADTILPVPGGGPASEAIQQLQSAGYNVSINWLEGHPNVPLSECRVNGISGLTAPLPPGQFETVYVDVDCPNAK